MRLGFVGVGRWATKLKLAFEAEGAKVVAHDRRALSAGKPPCSQYRDNPKNPCLRCGGEQLWPCHCDEYDEPDWGKRQFWQTMVKSPLIDALVLCAPPETTTEAAVACAKAGKPVMATKPLMLTREEGIKLTLRAPFYVDFWRLWDEGFSLMRAAYRSQSPNIKEVYAALTGAGPIRSFSGLLDYGPHAVAFVHELTGDIFDGIRLTQRVRNEDGSEFFWFVMNAENQAGANSIPCEVQAGNGASSSLRMLRFTTKLGETRGVEFVWEETPTETIFTGPGIRRVFNKEEALRRMCRAFMNDCAESFGTAEHLDLSCAVMDDLAEVRRLAEAKQ